jgi:hypothetical protein
MDNEDAHPAESRPPTLEDVLKLCRRLNELGARYLIVGGIAIIQHGFTRATEDIDLLVEGSLENQAKVKAALEVFEDKAIRELGDDDLRNYVVVRVADEVLVDLMLAACGIGYDEAIREAETVPIQGVPIPFATPKLLLRMKQTYREKDSLDREFLERKIRGEVP